MNALAHAHSGLRWIALILIVYAIINAILSKNKGEYLKKDKMLNLFAMVSLHVQLLIGLVLYLISPKVDFSAGWMKIELFRFYGLEHILGMVIAVVIFTIGRKKAEKANAPSLQHSKIITWYTIGLIIIIASIPWPFREALGGTWF